MSNYDILEWKVNLLIDYVTAPESATLFKESVLTELKELKRQAVVLRKDSPEVFIENLLTKLGMPTSVMGYDCCVKSLSLLVERPELKHNIVRGLYVEVAKALSMSKPANVERDIRSAIEVAWGRGDPDLLREVFGDTLDPNRGKPTNREFLCRLAQLVEREVN